MQNLLLAFRQHFERSQRLSEQGRQSDTEAYLILSKLQDQEVLWRGEYRSWGAFLAGEGVMASRWGTFKIGYKALKFDANRVRELGRPVVCRLARLPKKERDRIAAIITPSNYVRLLGDESDRTLQHITKNQMVKYIEQLKKLLRKAKAPLPKAPWE
jgi:hypothetical protein